VANVAVIGRDRVKTIAKAVLPDAARRWIASHRRRRLDRRFFQRHLRPKDVFLVGHPKSGNTWLTYMLAIVMENRFDHKKATLANVREFIPAFHARDKEIASYADFPEPRMFRNEGPIYPELYPKTIYIIRDPRAVLVSYYHHFLHDTGESSWPLEAFIDEMLAYGCIRRLEPYLVRWDRQVRYWLERSKHQAVKIVKYEDMKQDRRGVLVEAIAFAGITCDEKDIALAVERSSFDNMRKDEEMHGAEPYSGTKGERGYYVRRGTVDGWKEELSPGLAARVEREFSETMRLVGYLP